MVNASPERNITIRNITYHLPKPWTKRFSYVNGKQPTCRFSKSIFKPSLRNSHPFSDVACNSHPSPKPIPVSVRTVPIFTLQTKMAKLFTNFQTTPPKPIPVSGRSVPISKLQTKMAKLCIHLQTKTAPANTIPLGVAHTYIANVCTAAKTLFANVLLLQWCSHANT